MGASPLPSLGGYTWNIFATYTYKYIHIYRPCLILTLTLTFDLYFSDQLITTVHTIPEAVQWQILLAAFDTTKSCLLRRPRVLRETIGVAGRTGWRVFASKKTAAFELVLTKFVCLQNIAALPSWESLCFTSCLTGEVPSLPHHYGLRWLVDNMADVIQVGEQPGPAPSTWLASTSPRDTGTMASTSTMPVKTPPRSPCSGWTPNRRRRRLMLGSFNFYWRRYLWFNSTITWTSRSYNDAHIHCVDVWTTVRPTDDLELVLRMCRNILFILVVWVIVIATALEYWLFWSCQYAIRYCYWDLYISADQWTNSDRLNSGFGS